MKLQNEKLERICEKFTTKVLCRNQKLKNVVQYPRWRASTRIYIRSPKFKPICKFTREQHLAATGEKAVTQQPLMSRMPEKASDGDMNNLADSHVHSLLEATDLS